MGEGSPVYNFFDSISGVLWGPAVLIPLLVGVGIFLTILLRGLQFRTLGYSLWLALVKRKETTGTDGDVSHFQALSTALAATVGTGNIVGVATAIHWGGPGALFWMWFSGLVGMATKYSEAFLGVRFRKTDARGEKVGGPMYYLSEGIRGPVGKILAFAFTGFAVLASFGIGNGTQANSIAQQVNVVVGEFSEGSAVPNWAIGIVLVIAVALVIVGGIKSIARVASAVVPFMIVVYVLASLVVLLINIVDIPGALVMIVTDAFTGTAAAGGFAGAGFILALQYGIARGLFSNESGLGTGGIAAAAAKSTHPARQAMVSMTQTFIDTLIVVTCTGLVIVTSGAWRTGKDGAELTTIAFSDGLPSWIAALIVGFGLLFFAFTTMLGWAYYGERLMTRIMGRPGVHLYRVAFLVVIYIGATIALDTVWIIADVLNGLMALPNLIGLLILSPLIYRETRAFYANKDWKNPDFTAPEPEQQPGK